MTDRTDWDAELAGMEATVNQHLAALMARPTFPPNSANRPEPLRLHPSTGSEWEGRLHQARRAADEADAYLREQLLPCERWLATFTHWQQRLEQWCREPHGVLPDDDNRRDSPRRRE